MMAEAGARLFDELMRFKPDGLTANGWAVKAGVSRTIWADLRRHGNPSRRTLEKLLGAAGSSLAEFEALRVGNPTAPDPTGNGLADPNQAWRDAPLASIPLFDTSPNGEWGEAGGGIAAHSVDRSTIVDRIERPMALAADSGAYAVTMVGESMWPRFRAGRRLLVSPAAAVEIGEDVLVKVKGDQMLIKELVGRSEASIELRQFNPDVTFAVDAVDVAMIHRVVGEAV